MLQVAVFGARLLARLSVVGAVAKFQEAAEELARMHALNASPDSTATQVSLPLQLLLHNLILQAFTTVLRAAF